MAQKVFSPELVPSLKAYDAIRVSPKDLRPDPLLNGRVKLPDIAKFRRDFLDPKVGQVQPITIKKVDGLPIIVDGVTRWRAALELTEEGIGPHGGGVFYLKCQYVVAKTPADYFILTIKANIRNEPTPEDDAHNIALLIHNFMLTEEDIAERVYGKLTLDGKPDIAWVRERNALNDLTAEAMDALKAGRVKGKAAIALSKLTAELQREKLAELHEGQKLTVAAIKRASSPNGTQSTSAVSADAPRSGKPGKTAKWDKADVCAVLQRFCDASLPPHIAAMNSENAVREVLGQIMDEIECGQ